MIFRSKKKILKYIQKKKLFIFDFDGVIVDSVKIKDRIFYEIFQDDSLSIAKNSYIFHKKNQGKNRYYKIDHILNKYLKDKIIKKKFYYKKFKKIYLSKSKKIKIVPNFKIFLKKNINKTFLINSAAPKLEINKILKKNNLKYLISKIYGGESKKEDNFNHIFSNFNKEDALYFGDLDNDINLANKFNIDFCGVNLKYKKKLIKKNINYIFIKNFNEL